MKYGTIVEDSALLFCFPRFIMDMYWQMLLIFQKEESICIRSSPTILILERNVLKS